MVRGGGDTHLVSQISPVNAGDQWGDRCRRESTLMSCSRDCIPGSPGPFGPGLPMRHLEQMQIPILAFHGFCIYF